jgi:hypothetical protein
MVFILVVYYLLHPVRTAEAGIINPAFFRQVMGNRGFIPGA